MTTDPATGDGPTTPTATPSPSAGTSPAADARPTQTSAPAAPIAQAAPAAARRRRPASRLERGVLVAGNGREGLDWLGRPPEARASLLYRTVRVFARFVLFGLCRLQIETSGQEHLPRGGGYLVVAAAHRGWMDPFLVMHALPAEPRVWFLGSGPSTFTSRFRERFVHRLGGLLPVWRGGVGIDGHVASARAVIANGAVFAQMPEGTVSGPAGRLGPFRHGASLIALRTGAPIVPLAMAGTEELYLGRRMASRVLPATSAAAMLGGDWDGVLPPAGSREELELARRLTERLEALLGPVVEELHPRTVDPPSRPRRLRKRLTWLFLRPGRLDRDEVEPVELIGTASGQNDSPAATPGSDA